MKFYIKNFFSKCDQVHSFLRIWSHLQKKSLMENFIFCAVNKLMSTSMICQQNINAQVSKFHANYRFGSAKISWTSILRKWFIHSSKIFCD